MGRFYRDTQFLFRFTAFFLTLLLSFSHSVNLFAKSPQGEDSVSRFPIDEASNFLPPELGVIQDRYRGRAGKTVILLQDAHAIAEAQRSIQRLIDFFQKKYELRLIAVEGGAGKIDDPFFRSLAGPKEVREIFDAYLSRGEISGAVVAAVTNESRGEFYGIEDRALYDEEIRAYHKAREAAPRLLEEIGQLKTKLDQAKEKYYPAKLLEIDQALANFPGVLPDFPSLAKKLVEIKKPSGSRPFQAFIKEMLRTNQAEAPEVKQEIAKLAASLKSRLQDKNTLGELNQKSQAYATSEIDAKVFAHYLLDLAEKNTLSLRP